MIFGGIMAISEADYQDLHPLCFGYLASYLRERVAGVEICVFSSVEDLIDAGPDLVGISAGSINFIMATDAARHIKEALGVPVMIGGVHITVLPHTLPAPFDLGIIGEGEETLKELVELYMDKGRLEPADLRRVRGIVYRDDYGRPVVTEPRALIELLDSIPHPDRRLVGYTSGRTYMFTSRGCPYDCSFCSSQRHWGRYRTFSPGYVIEEIEQLISEFGTDEIHFFDDLFVADVSRLEAIARQVKERGLDRCVRFSCAIRANIASQRVMDALKSMGVQRVTFGAESCSDSVLRYLKGNSVTAEMNQRAVDLCHSYGIKIGPSFIKGSPHETGDDLLATYDFIFRNIRKRKIDYFEIHTLTPFPGTKVWDHALERGLVSEDMNWDELRVPWERLYLSEYPRARFTSSRA